MLDTLDVYDETSYREDLETNQGTWPRDRNWEDYISKGYIILDKPAGPTSHDVVSTVKKITGLEKAGHSGTLDPAVSGVLPVALGHSTKILSVFAESEKRYICNLQLKKSVELEDLKEVLREFQGRIYQFPPLKSNVARKLRIRTIFSIEVKDQVENQYLLDIKCQAGTYIRTLCQDIGKVLGTKGHMKELRRIVSAGFDEQETITLHDLYDAIQEAQEGLGDMKLRKVIRPMEEVLSQVSTLVIRNNAIESLVNGAKLAIPAIIGYQHFKQDEIVKIMTVKGELVALGRALESSDQIPTMEQGYVIQPTRVIFPRVNSK
ncbi:MAG: RNA-guided pseudouridylation complex pseudouridine synthase subunit Cbf5 [Candidatus Kariarchaeaceae archaeon]